ncbi:metalloregulator ArsR/SmtB family transcription factor [Alphaproteobacteria bacterium]|jgi:ArsR family transcriptional regulator, virulence genes transcriptional regulator|nr:metalloregulator ArsR/SmtB family transcription factor [Alphaproteobacteria bacterium]
MNQEHSLSLCPNKAAPVLSALANKKRLEILVALNGHSKPVGSIAKEVGLGQSALSQHLKILKQQRLVKNEREAQQVYYSIDPEYGSVIMESLAVLFQQER